MCIVFHHLKHLVFSELTGTVEYSQLSALDDVDEYDLLTVAEQKNKDKIPAKSAVASEDMGSIKDQPAVKTTLVPV